MRKKKTAIEERFWLFWGLAPKGTLKYKKGVDTLAFITQERKQWENEMREEEIATTGIAHVIEEKNE